jgi:hypothetical protein
LIGVEILLVAVRQIKILKTHLFGFSLPFVIFVCRLAERSASFPIFSGIARGDHLHGEISACMSERNIESGVWACGALLSQD